MPRKLSSDELDRFDHIQRELAAQVRVVEVPVLSPGVRAMTLGRVVLVRRGHGGDELLLAHELVHVQQWDRLGPPAFLGRYLAAYARNLIRLRRHQLAYRAIPLEVEARERARGWQERYRAPGSGSEDASGGGGI